MSSTVTDDTHEIPTQSTGDHRRVVIPATCALHRGTRGFANLVVSKLPDGTIELHPHAVGACTLILEEDGARQLVEKVREWLG